MVLAGNSNIRTDTRSPFTAFPKRASDPHFTKGESQGKAFSVVKVSSEVFAQLSARPEGLSTYLSCQVHLTWVPDASLQMFTSWERMIQDKH